MQGALLLLLWTGNGREVLRLGRDVPGSEKLYARKLWAACSYPFCPTPTSFAIEILEGRVLAKLGPITQRLRAIDYGYATAQLEF